MTDDKRMDEIIEVAGKISAAAEGHTNAAVLYALVNSLAMGVANTCRTQAEFEKSSDDVSAALRAAISGYWAAKQAKGSRL
jgi:hypothetical protein